MGVTIYKGTQNVDIVDPLGSGVNAVKGIDYAHHEIHAGASFFFTLTSTQLTANTEINICFTTPNTTKWLHTNFTYECTQAATFTILEGPAITADSGTETSPFNHDRNSATTSGILDLETVPVANKLSYNATITNAGTAIFTDITGSDKKNSEKSTISERDEIILKQNTTYAFRLLRDSTVATALGTLYLTWYEHTNV